MMEFHKEFSNEILNRVSNNPLPSFKFPNQPKIIPTKSPNKFDSPQKVKQPMKKKILAPSKMPPKRSRKYIQKRKIEKFFFFFISTFQKKKNNIFLNIK